MFWSLQDVKKAEARDEARRMVAILGRSVQWKERDVVNISFQKNASIVLVVVQDF